ncbi:MAG: thermonuclease family protein [Verrucomicrobia bacterium]|nr:thermonuclease family protein [Verrucomicrobiota bacterium]
MDASQARGLSPDDLVRFSSANQPVRAADAVGADLYTYEAEVARVVDGDTLWVKVWLKRPLWLKEKLRLRGLDAAEIDTEEGRVAKEFVEGQIKKTTRVLVTTTKPDKWDRYLSDVFLMLPGGEEVFLNNLLLEEGHARRLDKVALGDWEAV